MSARHPLRRGLFLVVAGALLVAVAFGAGWALAPDTDRVTEEADPDNTTYLVGVQGPGPNGNVTAIDGHGDVRWSIGDIISYQNVQRLDDGRVLATFAAGGYEACGPYDPPCKRTGYRIIDSEPEPTVEDEWSYPVKTRKDSEVHDAEMLDNGDVLVADMEWESIFTYDPESGERNWTWNASDHYEAPEDPRSEDWLHLNDVDYIGDDRYLVSIRNENQLLIVERGEGVVEVINEDGDEDVLNQQHNPHWLGDGAVVVADSENHRVVELHRNESSGEWEVAWQVAKVGGIAFDWPRDADRLPNGNTLVTDSRNNRVVEVTENGSVVASYEVPSLPYEADKVPHGEQPADTEGLEPYGTDRETDLGLFDRKIPVLWLLLAGARDVIALPYWVSEVHVFVVLVAGVLWLRGGYLLARAGLRGKG
ncbi:aryl-sulfate sulfotransferase [Halorussus salilacus]|uniref:aryl-sulfate sulfotransferase n=1 Tax=Halorussus salilacus TaxID=2953750 RepID=UPI00209ED830|nr:aryl-sulfate sulfotransferase [Halorussus salilacus]USZ67677.1 aryl-sulfate sulfotransferase [Halorussus salilacus]